MDPLSDLLAALDLESVDAGRFRGTSAGSGPVVFGGQLLGQAIVAASRSVAGKTLKSLHTVFARAATIDTPLEIDVDIAHEGRAFATADVTVRQADRTCMRALALLHQPDADLIRHQREAPDVAPPESCAPRPDYGWDVRFAGDVDIDAPDSTGPASLDVWTRMPGAPADPVLHQALLAYATDGFLIATAMRPHEGVGQSLAHVSISTTVISHTITFHEPIDVSNWHLMSHESPHAGSGRSYGRADVFRLDGRLVASFTQENMIRDFPTDRRPTPRERSRT